MYTKISVRTIYSDTLIALSKNFRFLNIVILLASEGNYFPLVLPEIDTTISLTLCVFVRNVVEPNDFVCVYQKKKNR